MGRRRTKSQVELVREASSAVDAIVGKSLGPVRDMTDAQWSETVELGTKALFVRCLAKGLEALEAVDAEKLAKSSAVAAATTGAILIDKAMDKLLPILNDGAGPRYDPKDIGNIIRRVEVTITELRDAGALEDVPAFEAIPGGQVIDAPIGEIGSGSNGSESNGGS